MRRHSSSAPAALAYCSFAVERSLVRLLITTEDGRDGDQALHVGLRIAADLELNQRCP